MKNFEEQLNEISKIMKKFVESDQMKQLQRYCEIISNLQKLGKDYNWVVVLTDINTNIANENESEIDKYFLSLIDNKIDLYQSIKNEISGCSYMIEKQKLMEQIFDAIDHGNYWIACIGLSTVLEFLLALESDFNSIKISVLLKNFMDNVGYIGINEHHFTTFLKEMPYEALWCIISLRTKIHERSDLIRQLYYTTTNT